MRAPQPSSTSSQSPQEGWPANRSPSGCPSRELGAVDGSTAALLASIAFDFNPGEAEIRGPSVSEGSRLFVKVSPPRRTYSLGWGPHCPRPPLPPRRHAPGEAVFSDSATTGLAWGLGTEAANCSPRAQEAPHTDSQTRETTHYTAVRRSEPSAPIGQPVSVTDSDTGTHHTGHSPRPRDRHATATSKEFPSA